MSVFILHACMHTYIHAYMHACMHILHEHIGTYMKSNTDMCPDKRLAHLRRQYKFGERQNGHAVHET
jgi:hypothetical protein